MVKPARRPILRISIEAEKVLSIVAMNCMPSGRVARDSSASSFAARADEMIITDAELQTTAWQRARISTLRWARENFMAGDDGRKRAGWQAGARRPWISRSEEHTSELQSL